MNTDWPNRFFSGAYNDLTDIEISKQIKKVAPFVSFLISSLNLKKTDNVLEVGCGYGRVSSVIVNNGYQVYGVDNSIDSLLISDRIKIKNPNNHKLICSDNLFLPFQDLSFDVVLNVYTSFGYSSNEENLKMLQEISRVIKKGGKFFLDYLNPDKILKNFEPIRIKETEKYHIVQKREYIEDEKILSSTWTFADKNSSESWSYDMTIKIYSLEKIINMLSIVGLKSQKIYGNIQGNSFSKESDRMIIISEKI